MVPLAALVAKLNGGAGLIDAAAIGRAADSLYRDPNAWDHWGTHDETLQHLKQLWHVLVRFGRPLRAERAL